MTGMEMAMVFVGVGVSVRYGKSSRGESQDAEVADWRHFRRSSLNMLENRIGCGMHFVCLRRTLLERYCKAPTRAIAINSRANVVIPRDKEWNEQNAQKRGSN